MRHTLVNQEFPEAHFLSLSFGKRCSTYSVSLSIAINSRIYSGVSGEELVWRGQGGERRYQCVRTHDCESSERALKRKARLPAGDELKKTELELFPQKL